MNKNDNDIKSGVFRTQQDEEDLEREYYQRKSIFYNRLKPVTDFYTVATFFFCFSSVSCV